MSTTNIEIPAKDNYNIPLYNQPNDDIYYMYDIMNLMSHRKQLTGVSSIIFFSMAIFQITAIAAVSCSNFKTVFAVLLGAGCLWTFITHFYMYGKTYPMVGSVGPEIVPQRSTGFLMQAFTFIRNIAPITAAAGIIGDGSQNCGGNITALTYILLVLYIILFLSSAYRYITIMMSIDTSSNKERNYVANQIKNSDFFKDNYLKDAASNP